MEPKKNKPGDPPARQSQGEHLDALLDDALEETFPASDPVAIGVEEKETSEADKTDKK